MAIVESTFSATQYASNIGVNAVVNSFRTGTPAPENGTVNLSSFHAYRSLAWFDAASIAEAVVGERILSVSFNATSAGDRAESNGSVPVRLYRTDLHYDSSKSGWTDADTLRPDSGMTYDNPYNEHFIEYGETGDFVKGATLTDSVFMTGDSASRLVSALADGCALGTWALQPGSGKSKDSPPYRVRFLSSVSITIRHEPETTDVTTPTQAIILDGYAASGSSVRLSVSGATQPESGVNDITGYMVSMRTSDDGETWGNWSNDEFIALAATEGTLIVTAAGDDDTHIQLRVATTSEMNTSDYLTANGEIIITEQPQIGSVLYEIVGRRIEYSVKVPASDYAGNLYIYCNDRCVGMMLADGGICRFSCVSTADGLHTDTITIHDEYGGISAEKTVSVYVQRKNIGNNWVMFNGKRSDDFGLLVTDFLPLSSAADRVKNETVVGRYGDVQSRESEAVYDAYDGQFTMLAPDGTDMTAVRCWLMGDGEMIFGNTPNDIYEVSIQQAIEFSRFSHGIADQVITVRVHIQPFRKHIDDVEMTIARSGLPVLNDGCASAYPVITLYGTGDLSVSIDGVKLTVGSVVGSCVIDTYNRVAVNADGGLLETSGDFPALPVGMSVIEFSQNVASGTIRRNRLFR